MRYKVIMKQYKSPNHLMVRLQDGKVLSASTDRLPKHLKVGDSGIMVQGHRAPHFKPDAIDIEYA